MTNSWTPLFNELANAWYIYESDAPNNQRLVATLSGPSAKFRAQIISNLFNDLIKDDQAIAKGNNT